MQYDDTRSRAAPNGSGTGTEQHPPISYKPSLCGNRILVVDDTPEICHLVAEILQDAGYVVLCAESGKTALAMLAKHAVDLVILDMIMPGLDGVATLHVIRRQLTVPVIVLSAVSDTALNAGHGSLEIAAYLAKPFSFQGLLETVQAVLQGHRQPQQLSERVKLN